MLDTEYSTADAAAQKGGAALDANNSSPGATNGDGAAILDQMVEEIRRHIILGPYYTEVTALWILHAHSIDAHRFSPRLHVFSPEFGCGKSNLLEILEILSGARGILVSNLTAAAFFRHVTTFTKENETPPVILIDEVDTFLNSDRTDAINILNSGHKRAGAKTIRCGSQETNYAAGAYNTWAPVVLAGIGTLTNAALASRTIAIPLKRKRREERVETFRDAARGRCEALAARAHRWAAENDAALREAEPVMPECLDNRLRNNWEPILAVADAAGDRWPQIARAAAMALAGEVDETPTEGAMLLEDIRKVWLPDNERLPTSTILERLRQLSDRPWGAGHGPHTPSTFQSRELAKILKPYGIEPKQLRFGSEKTRGYERADFADAWERYLHEPEPEPEPDTSA